MAIISADQQTGDDPLASSLGSIDKALGSNNWRDLDVLTSNCFHALKSDPRYRDDLRFLRVCFLYMDGSKEFESIFREMVMHKICIGKAMFYENFALYLEAKGRLIDASAIYNLGIKRNAQPLERLKRAHVLFLERISEQANNGCSYQTINNDIPMDSGDALVNPWSITLVKNLLQKMNSEVVKYEGYHARNRAYPGKSLFTLLKSSRNKTIDIGGENYQVKGCAGKGGFGQVFKAFVNSNPDNVVALKVQKPPFPWEFYMYRQLDLRIPKNERMCFGFAQRLHLYSDYSVLVCDYIAHGTLQDAINSNLVKGVGMDELLCMYYTIEMLHILEILHHAGIIHGDFKPDNLLVRYSRDHPTENENDFRFRSGVWHDQGLCLVDWGKGIDMTLFPKDTKFSGDSRTSGFRCVEMLEKKPWTFQVDLYGLCVIVHMMLHGSYMEIAKGALRDGRCLYHPKSYYKRYWKVELWEDLFTKLLNVNPAEDHTKLLRSLRESFQDYVASDQKLIKKLTELLIKQRTSLCSS